MGISTLLAVGQSGGDKLQTLVICVAVGTVLVLLALMGLFGFRERREIRAVKDLESGITARRSAGFGSHPAMSGAERLARDAREALTEGDYGRAERLAGEGMAILGEVC